MIIALTLDHSMDASRLQQQRRRDREHESARLDNRSPRGQRRQPRRGSQRDDAVAMADEHRIAENPDGRGVARSTPEGPLDVFGVHGRQRLELDDQRPGRRFDVSEERRVRRVRRVPQDGLRA
ncbi:MAG TPA: hypothetical protein VFV05_12255 [Methylomirabilota bacterium]|nr:hypothetical protein [Methylomirabilota bacterium]